MNNDAEELNTDKHGRLPVSKVITLQSVAIGIILVLAIIMAIYFTGI